MKRTLTLVLALFAISFSAEAATWQSMKDLFGFEMPDGPPAIKVLVGKDLSEVQLQVTGGYRVYDPIKGSRVSFGFFEKNYPIVPDREGLRWGQLFTDTFILTLVPDNNKGVIDLNGAEYKGRLHIYQIDGRISLVNEVPIEDYVKSVVAAEINPDSPDEVISSIALVERTEAYYHVLRGQRAYWDVEADDVQYFGNSVTYSHKHIDRVVNQTKGMILTLSDDRPFMAKWTEHSAGKTVPYQVMFRKNHPAPTERVSSIVAKNNKNATAWSVPVKQERLAEIAGLEKVTAIQLFADQETQKVYAIRLLNGEEYADISYSVLQKSVGKDQLKSSEFTAQFVEKEVLFSGFGRGHGVGLCLYSANEMAKQGLNADTILETFFPGAHIAVIPGSDAKFMELKLSDPVAEELASR